jgi:hypothetical protein
MTAPNAQTKINRAKKTPPPRSPSEAPPTWTSQSYAEFAIPDSHPREGDPIRPAVNLRPKRALMLGEYTVAIWIATNKVVVDISKSLA